MNVEHRVEIKKGPHGTQIPRGAQKLLKRLFKCAEFKEPYFFNVLLGGRVRGSGQNKEIEVKNIEKKRGSIILIGKPGDNGTRHNFFVFCPEGYTGSIDDLHHRLKKGEEKMLQTEDREECKDDSLTGADQNKDLILGGTTIEDKQPADPIGAPVTNNPEPTKDTKRYRVVSKIFDETMIKYVLTEILGTKKDRIAIVDLGKVIGSCGVDCDSRQVMIFLKKEGYIKEVERINKMKAFFSLGEKGRKLLDLRKDKQKDPCKPVEMPTPEKTTSETDLLSKFEEIKVELETANERLSAFEQKVTEAKEKFEIESEKVREIKKRKEEIRKQILAIIS